MNINLIFIPTIILTLISFHISRELWIKKTKPLFRLVFFVIGVIFFIPAFLFVFYYLHWMDNAVWYYQFRTVPYIELFASGAGILAGILAGASKKHIRLSSTFFICILIIGIFIPHSKSTIFPVDYEELENKWRNDFCIQSSNATCGPASASTILNHYGVSITETELAKKCYSYIGGTEIWYIARTLNRMGFECQFKIFQNKPYDLPYPSIAGIDIGAGHFITIIDKQNDIYIIGDPLVGRKTISEKDIFRRINFTGFFLVVSKNE